MRDTNRRRLGDERPLVSIVTPTRNMVAHLGQTIESVAAQTYEAIEHIVVDGASTDGSVELLARAASANPRLRWTSADDAGQADAIRKGFELARGDILTWLNADDVYLTPTAVSQVVRAFQRRPDASLVTAGGMYLGEDGRPLRPIPAPRRLTLDRLRRCDLLLQPATFFRASVTAAVPLDTTLHFAFDWDFFARALAGREVVILPEHIAGYRLHGQNKTTSGASRRTSELAEVTARHLGRRSWQYAVLRAAAAADASIDRLPPRSRRLLRRALYGGVLHPIHVASRRALQI